MEEAEKKMETKIGKKVVRKKYTLIYTFHYYCCNNSMNFAFCGILNTTSRTRKITIFSRLTVKVFSSVLRQSIKASRKCVTFSLLVKVNDLQNDPPYDTPDLWSDANEKRSVCDQLECIFLFLLSATILECRLKRVYAVVFLLTDFFAVFVDVHDERTYSHVYEWEYEPQENVFNSKQQKTRAEN
jgi:hypothetical protein